MKIIEAVRLGVLGFALSLLCGVAAAPVFASENDAPADWKKVLLSEVADIVDTWHEKSKHSESSNAEFNTANSTYGSMYAFCVGFAHGAQIPTPEHIVEFSVSLHKDFMRGKIPSGKSIVRLGELCMNHGEESLIKQSGASREDIKKALLPVTREALQKVREKFGL